MQDRFSALLPILGAIVAFLIAALLVLYIIRLLFGRGIRSAAKKGSRRLDVVDVFDLDRERQLVIVRRDNMEHLLLIGGPNDLLVEGAIAPADAAAMRPARENRPAPAPAAAGWPAEPAAEPAAPPSAPARPGGPLNLPPDLFAPASKGPPKPAAPEATPALAATSAPTPPAPAPTAPTPAAPPSPPTPPRPAAPPPPPAARPAPPRAATPPFLARTQRVLQPKPDAGPATPPPAPPAAPRPAAPPPPPPSGPQASPLAPTAPNRPVAPPPAPPPSPAPPAPIVDVDPLESLEAEMARLLGRPDKE